VRGLALRAFGEIIESINVLIESTSHEGALNNPEKNRPEQLKGCLRADVLVAKAPVGPLCGHHGSRVALRRPWVRQRHRPAARCSAPCPGLSPGRLAGGLRLPPARGRTRRLLLRGVRIKSTQSFYKTWECRESTKKTWRRKWARVPSPISIFSCGRTCPRQI
jgi:hypothetical protein